MNYLKMVVLNPHDTIQFFIDLFPNKGVLGEGKHMARVHFKIPIDDSFFIITSNWTEFIFKETSNGMFPCYK